MTQFYKELGDWRMNLETTTSMCQLVMALKHLHLKSTDWEDQAKAAAKSEWGPDTEIEFNEKFCVVKNLKTGKQKTIEPQEQE